MLGFQTVRDQGMRSEVSLIIKTFERPKSLERLLHSILSSSASGCRILVADDSWRGTPSDLFAYEEIDYFKLPYDSGLSYGRNYLVDRVRTPYCVLLDDDLVFTHETRLEILLEIVKRKGFDLAAGEGNLLTRGKPGFANMEVRDRNLIIDPGAAPRSYFNGLPVYDLVNNFFLARTETLRDIRWDERFKIYGEHNDFFLRYSAKYRATYTDKVVIDHHEGGYSLLGKMGKYSPSRQFRSSRVFARKHGVTRAGGTHIAGVRGFFNVYVPALRRLIGYGCGCLMKRIGIERRRG
jgi:GT2 family glycosyltransferase